jgi:hypothetical protein
MDRLPLGPTVEEGMTQYTPKNVETGIRDFIVHKTGSAAESVEVLAEGFGFIVQVRADIPEDVEDQIRLMLPDEYQLEMV